jgi:hypothetical protein
MAGEPVDVVLSARECGVGREEAMREHLAREIDLVDQMAEDDDQRFRVVAGCPGERQSQFLPARPRRPGQA